MKYVIASDFHLKFIENTDDIKRRLLVEEFLRSLIGQIDGLILAGDIFDLWVEWDKVIIKNYFNVLKIFSLLKDAGCRLIFLSGNHDFWIGSFLKEVIGFEVYNDYFTDVINNKKIFVSHGDLFTKNDLRYQVFRKIVRAKLVQSIFKIIHPDFSLSIGQLLSRSSRNRKDPISLVNTKEKGLQEKAQKLCEKYDVVIFGHSHNPLKIDYNDRIYLNCGDWLKNNSFCYFDEEKIELQFYTKSKTD